MRKRITVRLPDDTYHQLNELSKKHDLPTALLAREMIERMMAKLAAK